MADRYHNPFQGIDISVPVEFHEDMTRYSQREGKAVIDQSPFPRMVDMWFLALSIAAREGLPPADTSRYESRKIIEGSIFANDPWRIHSIMLVAIALTGSVDVVAEPRRMMSIANGLAIAGLPRLLEMLKDGDGEPIWNLSEAVEGLIKKRKVA